MIEEFYKPAEGEGGEVLNFDQIINEDDDQEYNHFLDKDELPEGSKALGAI